MPVDTARWPESPRLAVPPEPIIKRLKSTTTRWIASWLGALVLLTILIGLAAPTGWLGSDDAAYYSAAEQVLDGVPITRLHHHYARMAMIVPVAVSIAVFGQTTGAVVLPVLTASIACVILVAILGRVIWGWWEGLLAATMVSVLPYFRVLSTTAFPDVLVCLWTTASMLLAAVAFSVRNRNAFCTLLIASGFVAGMAVSAKVFAATVGFGIAMLAVQQFPPAARRMRSDTRRQVWIAFASFAIGGLLFFLLEGCFYARVANDFFFSLHAHEQSQSGVGGMVVGDGSSGGGIQQLIWDRLTLLLHPSVSGWGALGALFWPAVFFTGLLNRAGRSLAIWAAATYLLVAFLPVSLEDGYQPYPIFHGRHILPACVPFALCLAWLMRCGSTIVLGESWTVRAGPVWAAVIVAMGFVNPRELSGFRDRPTGRLGAAITQIIEATDWDADRPIVISPSMYWRYRILFPESLKSRLRVAADPEAPTWWRHTTSDVVARSGPLPPPDRAYLIATPYQLEGKAEPWDYDVTLPPNELSAWRSTPTTLTMVRYANRKIGPARPDEPAATPIVMLLGVDADDRRIETTQSASALQP